MKLFGILASNNVRKPYAVALHLGISLETVDAGPFTAHPDDPEFRKASPAGRIPALIDGDLYLNESNAIMLYLSSLKPGVLMPTDLKQQAQVHQWLAWCAAHWSTSWQPMQFENFIKPVFLKGETDVAVAAAGERSFHKNAGLLDSHLSSRQWIVGETLSLADFAIAAGLSYVQPSKIPLEKYTHVVAWYDRVSALPAWQNSAVNLG